MDGCDYKPRLHEKIRLRQGELESSLKRLRADARLRSEARENMTTLAIFLLVLWLLGVLSGITLGGYIHVLIGAVILIMMVRGTRPRRQVD